MNTVSHKITIACICNLRKNYFTLENVHLPADFLEVASSPPLPDLASNRVQIDRDTRYTLDKPFPSWSLLDASFLRGSGIGRLLLNPSDLSIGYERYRTDLLLSRGRTGSRRFSPPIPESYFDKTTTGVQRGYLEWHPLRCG